MRRLRYYYFYHRYIWTQLEELSHLYVQHINDNAAIRIYIKHKFKNYLAQLNDLERRAAQEGVYIVEE